MKKILVVLFLLFFVKIVDAQITEEMYDKKVVEIEVLKKQLNDTLKGKNILIEKLNEQVLFETKKYNDMVNSCQLISIQFKDTIEGLKIELTNLKEFKKLKKQYEVWLKEKSDSIVLLQNNLLAKDKQITQSIQQGEKKALESIEKGKAITLSSIKSFYKNRSFDDLIRLSNIGSVAADMILLRSDTEVDTILKNLLIYFNAKELLAKKMDKSQIEITQKQLSDIKYQSKLLDELKDNINYYIDINNSLKETISILVEEDEAKPAGGDMLVKEIKIKEIAAVLVNFMYNNYNYEQYPYLSNILIEIIKRKKLDVDADVTDLLKKLE